MPSINIPTVVRFGMYLTAALGSLFVQYFIEKTWWTDAEQHLWTGIAGLLLLLAASKTLPKTDDNNPDDPA